MQVNMIKESTCQRRRCGFDPWVGKIKWQMGKSNGLGRRKWQPTPGFLPGKLHGQGSPADFSPWDRKELDTTEQLKQHD